VTQEEKDFEYKLKDVPSEQVYDSASRNKQNIMGWFPTWFEHYLRNAQTVIDDFEAGNRNASAANVRQGIDTTKVLCCGSGPSLELLAPYIKDWDGLLIAGPSNASFCMAHGRQPDYVVFIDASPEHLVHVKRVPWTDEVNMVLSPHVSPSVVDYCEKTRCWYKSHIQSEEYSWFNQATDLLYQPINDYMLQAGCTANQEIILSQLFMTLKKYDIQEIYLAGFDFSYPNWNVSRVTQYRYQSNLGIYIASPPSKIRTRANLRTSLNGKLTDRSMLGYKRSLYVAWYSLNMDVSNNLNLYNLSDGIVDDIPRPLKNGSLRMQVKNIVSGHHRPYRYSKEVIRSRFHEYMRRVEKPAEARTNIDVHVPVPPGEATPKAGVPLVFKTREGYATGYYNGRAYVADGVEVSEKENYIVTWMYLEK
jgi:uncharacterized protein (DUF1778 family)